MEKTTTQQTSKAVSTKVATPNTTVAVTTAEPIKTTSIDKAAAKVATVKAPKEAKVATAVYSTPVSKDAKEFILNEASRTGLSQKGIIDAALTALKAGKQLPNAMPIKL